MLTHTRIAALVGAALLALAGATATGVSPASADSSGGCTQTGFGGATCTGSGGSTGGGGDTGTASGGVCMDSSASVDYNGTTYPCGSSDAPGQWWYVGGGCYSAEVPPSQWPPVGDPRWGGHTPADNGIIVYRSCGSTSPSITGSFLTWERCIGNCVTFNPDFVKDQLKMAAPDILMAPPAGTVGLVRQNVWFWTDTDMADHTVTETSGANVIVGTRTLTALDWNWGDGTTTDLASWPLACRPYTAADGGAAAPDGCGHVYTQPSKVVNGAAVPYTITVTAQWTFTYSYNGGPQQAIQVPALTKTATITIKEGQSANG